MLIAYCCILIAALLPYVWVGIAKTAAPGYNNKNPRAWIAQQESHRVRNAYGAHLNAFEAFPPFAAAVLMAQFARVDPQWVTWLAVGFIVFRILHGIFYLTAVHLLRSLVWFGGLLCVLSLMVLAILGLAT